MAIRWTAASSQDPGATITSTAPMLSSVRSPSGNLSALTQQGPTVNYARRCRCLGDSFLDGFLHDHLNLT